MLIDKNKYIIIFAIQEIPVFFVFQNIHFLIKWNLKVLCLFYVIFSLTDKYAWKVFSKTLSTFYHFHLM